jgi:integrase
LEALTVGQVDLHHGLIDLMPADATAQQRQSKKRNPVVPIVADIRDRLAKLIAGKAPADKVLPPRDYYLRFKEHLQSLDLEEKSYPHVLRHTRATHLLQAGVSIYDVAKLLGDTVATVEKSYGHHSSDYLANSLRGKGPKLD